MPSIDDDNRVILEPIPGYMNCHHDYINASYIDVSMHGQHYKVIIIFIHFIMTGIPPT